MLLLAPSHNLSAPAHPLPFALGERCFHVTTGDNVHRFHVTTSVNVSDSEQRMTTPFHVTTGVNVFAPAASFRV